MSAERRTEWGAARAAFLARLDEVRREVERGVPLTKIHRTLGLSGVSVSYKQFCIYVKRYTRSASARDVGDVAPGRVEVSPATATVTHARRNEGTASVPAGGAGGTQGRPPSPTGGVAATGVGFPRVTHNPNASSREDLV